MTQEECKLKQQGYESRTLINIIEQEDAQLDL
uniref:Uncharacterized protein n=1 Tax=Rhizophora mucronata TaxID=61149 RepID=A0A2P2QK07_RHIMU